MTPSPGDPGDFQHEQRTPLYGGFSEADLVEQPAIELFSGLGWTTRNLFGEFSHGASAEGRASRRDVTLPDRMRRALKKLNPSLPDAALEDAYSTLTRERVAIDSIRANSEVHDLLRKGIPVEVRGKDGERKTEIVRVIDWENPDANDFFLASQVWFAGELYTKRADLVGFVNGLPLLFVELKASHKAMADAYNGNLADYRDDDPARLHAERLRDPVERARSRARRALRAARILQRVEADRRRGGGGRRQPRHADQGHVPAGAAPRPRREFHRLRGGQARPRQEDRARHHQLLGVNRAIRAVDDIDENRGGSASSGTRRARARASRCCSSPARCCARSRATGRF